MLPRYVPLQLLPVVMPRFIEAVINQSVFSSPWRQPLHAFIVI
jgi:hypothetical protein